MKSLYDFCVFVVKLSKYCFGKIQLTGTEPRFTDAVKPGQADFHLRPTRSLPIFLNPQSGRR